MALLPAQKKGLVLLVKADHYGLPFALAEVGLRVTSLLAAIPVFLRASGLLRFRLALCPTWPGSPSSLVASPGYGPSYAPA